MSILNLIAQVMNMAPNKKSTKEVIASARTDLNDIGSVFRTTINQYRSHAEQVKAQANEYAVEVERLRRRELEARKAEVDLLNVATEAEQMASKIEDSIGIKGSTMEAAA